MRSYKCYLSFVHDITVKISSLDYISIVCKVSDIFLANQLTTFFQCEIKFGNNLQSGTKPISMEPYHIALFEYKKLNPQLQDLLGKGFIRMSTSTYGARLFHEENNDSMHMCIKYSKLNEVIMKNRYHMPHIDDS